MRRGAVPVSVAIVRPLRASHHGQQFVADVCGGDACIKNTRISVWGLEEWRRLGWSDAKILDAYPQLTQENLAAAWAYVEQHPEEIEGAIRENQEA